MRRFIGILLVVVLYYFSLLFMQISYNLDGYANQIFGFFWRIFSILNGTDLIKEFVLFITIAVGFYGTFALGKSEEKRTWSIIGLIMTVVSFLMFIKD